MELRSQFRDISVEEEARLPLPPDWIRALKIGESGSARIYRHARTGQEMREHPILLQALAMTKKRPLPFGWAIKDVMQNGVLEQYYYNADLNISMWDHPTLRDCTIECLLGLGYDLDYISSLLLHPPPPPLPTSPLPGSQQDEGARGYEGGSELQPEAAVGHEESKSTNVPLSPLLQHQLKAKLHQQSLHSRIEVAPSPPSNELSRRPSASSFFSEPSVMLSRMHLNDIGTSFEALDGEQGQPLHLDDDGNSHSNHDDEALVDEDFPLPDVPPPDQSLSPTHTLDRWETVLQQRAPSGDDYPHRSADPPQLPISASSLKILRLDVEACISAVHRQLVELRAILASRKGRVCRVLEYRSDAPQSEDERTIVTLASDIVTELKQQPQYIVAAMAHSQSLGSSAMLQIAFVSLHRLLHPFSTDNSLTTALLLEGINHQVADLSTLDPVLSMLGTEDSRQILARALFIADPHLGLDWKPLSDPLPTVPAVASETVLTSLLRVYAVRRDVTCYWRAVWMPVLPAISTLLQNPVDLADPLVLPNLLIVAHRLLECTFSDKAMTAFPPIATAVCRALCEIGGLDAMHYMIFYLNIFPNLVKILGGDHDSLENEDVYQVHGVRAIVNKYFDVNLWMSRPERQEGMDDAALQSLEILAALLWMIWKLFTSAAFMSEPAIACINTQSFLHPRLAHFNTQGVKDRKLQNLVTRLKRRISHASAWLQRMPLDLQGSEFLGLNENQNLFGLPSSPETTDLLDRRISSLAFKPGEMLNLSVVSRAEAVGLFADVGMAMDAMDLAEDTPVYQAIATFLSLYADSDQSLEDFGEEEGDDAEAEEEDGGGDEEELESGDGERPRRLRRRRRGRLVAAPSLATASPATPAPTEELIQLTFLYSSDATQYDERQGIDKEDMARCYWQLVRGIKLCTRYYDTLSHLLRKVQAQEISNIHELVEDRGWYFEPEFDLDFKVEQVDIYDKHTEGSRQKIRHPKYGLQHDLPAPVFPLFSKYSAQGESGKSWTELQRDAVASLRFGSAHRAVAVGTSLARERVLSPKIQPSQLKVTTLPAEKLKAATQPFTSESSSRSTFTHASVRPNASFLAPTQAYKNMQLPSRAHHKQYDESFMKSMRTHDIIPAQEFQSRYARKQRGWYFQNSDKLSLRTRTVADPDHRQVNETAASASPKKKTPRKPTMASSPGATGVYAGSPQAAALPFPEHLRHRIRQGDGDKWGETTETLGEGAGSGAAATSSSPSSPSLSPHRSRLADWKAMKALIADYHTHILQVPPSPSRSASGGETPRGRGRGGPSSRDRSRSPSMPRNFETGNALLTPTESTARRLASREPEVPVLRAYDPNELAAVHSSPFLLTRAKIYPPTGLRIPRVPSHLQPSPHPDSADQGHRSEGEDGGSPRRGRERERSRSPGGSIQGSVQSKPSTASTPITPGLATAQRRTSYLSATVASTHSQWHTIPRRDLETADGNASTSSGAASRAATSTTARWQAPRLPQDQEETLIDSPGSEQEARRGGAREAAAPTRESRTSRSSSPETAGHRDHGGSSSSVSSAGSRRQSVPAPLPRRAAASGVGADKPHKALFADALVSAAAEITREAPPPAASATPSRTPAPPPPPPPTPATPAIAPESPAPPPASQSAPPSRPTLLSSPSSYSLRFTSDLSTSQQINLPEDRKRGKEVRYQRLLATEEETEDTGVPRAIRSRPHVERERPAPAASYPSHSDEAGDPSQSPPPSQGLHIPLVKRKSLIVEGEEMKAVLMKGIVAVKHGRAGSPKRKVVRYNPETQTIEWSAAERSIFSSPKPPTALFLSEVSEVCKGTKTDVFQRAGLVDPNCCLSIVASDRTLDLAFATAADRDNVLRGLRCIVPPTVRFH